MIGILTEKPSAGRNFAKALGGMSGTYRGEAFTIVCARGHLYEYASPDKQVPDAYQARYESWDMRYLPWDETLFSWKREKKPDVAKELRNIKAVLSKCSEVVIATDVDPTGEGELLAWEILDELGLRSRNRTFSRMYFTDESVKELQKAFTGRKVLPPMEQDMDFVKAQYRSQWDMLSMQFTRIATGCVNNAAVLREGRLKSAMVKITGDGLKAVAEYKRILFYVNKFKDENGVIYSNPEEPRFPDESQVPRIYRNSTVVKDSTELKQTAPPKLIDLAGLSARLSSQGFSAKQVLDVYQKMYEAQVVSYPRTEDKVITPEQFNDLLPKVDAIAAVVGVDSRLLTYRQPRKTHVKTGGAHGANRPGPNVPRSLQDLLQYGTCAPQIYEILAKNYLAMLAENYEYEYQKGHIKDYPKFVGTASVPRKPGWKLVFSDDAKPAEDENAGGLGTMASPFVAEGANPKPPTPTMKWLMAQLEKYDVGTGATRTSTYAEVTKADAKYPLLSENKGRLFMSPCGQMSYELLPDTYIGDVRMTEQLQQEMRDIANGRADPAACLRKIRDYVVHDMEIMKRNAAGMKLPEHTTQRSGNMGSSDVRKEKYAGTWKGKQVSFNREWGGHRFTDQECKDLLAGKTISVFGLKSKKGSTYGVTGRLAELEYNGSPYVGFERLGFAHEDKIPDSWCRHKFTDDEKTLLEAGKEVYVEGFISQKGNVFNCYVRYGDDKGEKKIIPNFDRK